MPHPFRTLFSVYTDFHRLYLARLNALLVPYRLYSAQWAVLKRLYHTEPQTVAGLARLHQVETPTMTGSVQKLRRLGYLDVRRGKDRREKHLLLTDAGRAVCGEIMSVCDSLNRRILRGIPERDQELCCGLFETLNENLRQLDALD